ncbi:hypothetical protein [Thermosynechococcus sp.]|uniref:hypothetical protein n=1 Tax=Thermosynechococcus sp. TaxID=2814275 RepID=UPI00391BD316
MRQASTPEDIRRLLGELLEAQKETERLLREEAHQLNQQLSKLGDRLGEFVEWQVRPAVLRLFRSRGIAVSQLYSDGILQDGNDSLEAEVARYAYRQGLFVLAQSGEGVTILNEAQFQPRRW